MLIKDEWLTQYFKKEVFALKLPDDDSAAFQPSLQIKNGFIYTKVPINHVRHLHKLTEDNFYLVETQIIWQQNQLYCLSKNHVNKNDSELEIRQANDSDLQGVQQIAKDAFLHSRFYTDPNISNELASQIKIDWVTNYFKGQRGDNMIVALRQDEVVGFLITIAHTTIDLVAVSNKHYNKNIGSSLIAFANKSIGLLTAGTQLSNLASSKLYQKTGFNLKSAFYVLHKHL